MKLDQTTLCYGYVVQCKGVFFILSSDLALLAFLSP